MESMLNKNGIKFKRKNSRDGIDSYDLFNWKTTDVVLRNWRDNSINFEQRGVTFPDNWSENAINIVTSKYFRGKTGSPERESSLKELIERVVEAYRVEGLKGKYFFSEKDADIFKEELKYALLSQQFAFNSPVWFNVGTTSPWQVSACYILAVEDNMNDILNWYKEEGLIFKGGSGAGINLSNLRSSKEYLKSGGRASGPVSFMRGADASAGTIKSGGATRRAAKMVILDINHPDIEEFVECKALEERKIRTLRDAGYDMDLGGRDSFSVQYQNANNSVRIYDDFFEAYYKSAKYNLLSREGRVIDTIDSRELMAKIAKAAWECADPGVQYDSTIQKWHTLPNSGRITATNPCSEFLHLDNSSCNLASIKLTAFYDQNKKSFDIDGFAYLTRLIMIAAEISVEFGHFPTAKIGEVTKAARPIGLGYTDLGALLMQTGVGYDSKEGRSLAAGITSLLTAEAYLASTELANAVGTFKYYNKNKESFLNVMAMHNQANKKLEEEASKDVINIKDIITASDKIWDEVLLKGAVRGFRNSQATVLAPTGTISFFMDSTTTGVEPDFALVKYKKVADGSSMKIVNNEVKTGLKSLGYSQKLIGEIVNFIEDNDTIVGAPGLKSEDYGVFATAVGDNVISPWGHIKMMAAIQPFISGAISKTVNMPQESTVEEIEEVYVKGYEMGLKAIAIYRDNCKVGQPLSSKKIETVINTTKELSHPSRVRLERQRKSLTTSFSVGGGEGYLVAGSYEDGNLGEIFLKFSKQGSTLAGVLDAFAIAISIGLQHGVPLETFTDKFINMRFEPSGLTNDPEIRMSSSLLDYIFRRLTLDYLDQETRTELGIYSSEERIDQINDTYSTPVNKDKVASSVSVPQRSDDAPLCYDCGVRMQRSGACYVCPQCATTSGCS